MAQGLSATFDPWASWSQTFLSDTLGLRALSPVYKGHRESTLDDAGMTV